MIRHDSFLLSTLLYCRPHGTVFVQTGPVHARPFQASKLSREPGADLEKILIPHEPRGFTCGIHNHPKLKQVTVRDRMGDKRDPSEMTAPVAVVHVEGMFAYLSSPVHTHGIRGAGTMSSTQTERMDLEVH